MKRVIFCAVVFAAAAVIIAGCGGGGGGDNPPPTGSFVITGYVYIDGSTTPVTGAVVTIGGKSSTTSSTGKFTLSFDSRPSVFTFSVDLVSASPAVHTTYVRMNSDDGLGLRIQPANAVTLPILPSTGGTIGPIYAFDASLPPPPPP